MHNFTPSTLRKKNFGALFACQSVVLVTKKLQVPNDLCDSIRRMLESLVFNTCS